MIAGTDRGRNGAPDTIRTCDLCLRRAARQQWYARTRSGVCGWKKIEEAKSGGADFLLKLLKRLARPKRFELLAAYDEPEVLMAN
jgi:hypothetical protein